MVSPTPGGTVILVLTDMDDDDFEIIADNIEFRDDILFLCDKEYSGEERRETLNLIIDSLQNPKSAISKLKAWAKRHNRRFSAVIGLDEEYRYRVSEAIAKEFGLKFYPPSTLHLCSNKYLQRVALSNAGIGVPDFQLVGPDTLRFMIGYPNVLKLMTGVGSTHLHLNRSERELRANINRMDAELRKDTSNPVLKRYMAGEESIDPTSDFMLEGYLEGNEYSCDYIVEEEREEVRKAGKGTRKKPGRGAGKGKVKARVLRVVRKLEEKDDFGYFAGFYLHNPDTDKGSEFRLGGKDGLEAFCTNVANTLGIRFGVCMLDFKFHKGKFYVIETTLRPGVATFVELMARQYGYISLSQCIRQRLGMPLIKKIPRQGGLVAYLNAPEKGVITKIDFSHISENASQLGILKIHKYCEVGQSSINVAYVLASCASLKDALHKFELIRGRSVIEVD